MKWAGVICLLVLASTLLAACGSDVTGASVVTQPAPTPTQAPIPTGGPSTGGFGIVQCPSITRSQEGLNALVPNLQSGNVQIASITCANLKGDGSLQVIITTKHSGSSGIEDLYI